MDVQKKKKTNLLFFFVSFFYLKKHSHSYHNYIPKVKTCQGLFFMDTKREGSERLGFAPNLFGRSQRSWGAGPASGLTPPNPPTLYYIKRSCVLSSIFKQKNIFFIIYIFPLLLYHIFSYQVKYFFKNFLKKFTKKVLLFCFCCDIIYM